MKEKKAKFWRLCKVILNNAGTVEYTRDFEENKWVITSYKLKYGKWKICVRTDDLARENVTFLYIENADEGLGRSCWSYCPENIEDFMDTIRNSWLDFLLDEM